MRYLTIRILCPKPERTDDILAAVREVAETAHRRRKYSSGDVRRQSDNQRQDLPRRVRGRHEKRMMNMLRGAVTGAYPQITGDVNGLQRFVKRYQNRAEPGLEITGA